MQFSCVFADHPMCVSSPCSNISIELVSFVYSSNGYHMYRCYHAYKESSCIIMSPYAVLYNNLFCTVFCVHMYSDVHRVLE